MKVRFRRLFAKSRRRYTRNRRLRVEPLERRAVLTTFVLDFVSSVTGNATPSGPGSIPVGEPVSGHIEFDNTDAIDTNADPDVGNYAVAGEFTLTMGSVTRSATNARIQVRNDTGFGDRVEFQWFDGTLAQVVLSDSTQSVLTGDGLTLPDLGEFDVSSAVLESPFVNFAFASPLLPPAVEDLAEDLIADIESLVVENRAKPLAKQLNNALASFEADNADTRNDFVNKLESFIKKVQSQSGKKIDSSVADELIAKAQAIIDLAE